MNRFPEQAPLDPVSVLLANRLRAPAVIRAHAVDQLAVQHPASLLPHYFHYQTGWNAKNINGLIQ